MAPDQNANQDDDLPPREQAAHESQNEAGDPERPDPQALNDNNSQPIVYHIHTTAGATTSISIEGGMISFRELPPQHRGPGLHHCIWQSLCNIGTWFRDITTVTFGAIASFIDGLHLGHCCMLAYWIVNRGDGVLSKIIVLYFASKLIGKVVGRLVYWMATRA
jgi:hypothetical protein